MPTLNKHMIDIIDLDGNKVAEIRSGACGAEVANKMRKQGIPNCDYQFGTYTAKDGKNRNCWKPVKSRKRLKIADLINVYHNK